MHPRVVLHPAQEGPPARVLVALREMAVPDLGADLQVFNGNPAARRDERACLFSGKVLALPLHLQISFRQGLFGFLPIVRLLLLAGETAVQPLEPLFRRAVVAGVPSSLYS